MLTPQLGMSSLVTEAFCCSLKVWEFPASTSSNWGLQKHQSFRIFQLRKHRNLRKCQKDALIPRQSVLLTIIVCFLFLSCVLIFTGLRLQRRHRILLGCVPEQRLIWINLILLISSFDQGATFCQFHDRFVVLYSRVFIFLVLSLM